MNAYRIVVYLNPYKGGIEGPIIWANSLDEADKKAQEMYPGVDVMTERID